MHLNQMQVQMRINQMQVQMPHLHLHLQMEVHLSTSLIHSSISVRGPIKKCTEKIAIPNFDELCGRLVRWLYAHYVCKKY